MWGMNDVTEIVHVISSDAADRQVDVKSFKTVFGVLRPWSLESPPEWNPVGSFVPIPFSEGLSSFTGEAFRREDRARTYFYR